MHLDGGFYLAQPAFRVMKKQGYGRFVFISSTAGMFGQHLESHYAAAKAGLVGLTNIIALEGAPHGILANTVLPTGFSRMVTETVADTQALEESGFLDMIRPELVTPMVVYLASRACEFSHRNYSAIGGRYARVFIGLAQGWLAERSTEPTADDVAAHIAEISATEGFTIPETNYEEVFEVTERLAASPTLSARFAEPVDQVRGDAVGLELPGHEISGADPRLALPLTERDAGARRTRGRGQHPDPFQRLLDTARAERVRVDDRLAAGCGRRRS